MTTPQGVDFERSPHFSTTSAYGGGLQVGLKVLNVVRVHVHQGLYAHKTKTLNPQFVHRVPLSPKTETT